VTEIFEYVLAVAVSSALAASSLMVMHGSLPFLGQVQADSQFNQIMGAANLSIIRGGDVSIVVAMSNASLSCGSAQLDFGSNGQHYSSSIGSVCSFQYSNLSCLCTLLFRSANESLELEVRS
jgi:hypothetical protein